MKDGSVKLSAEVHAKLKEFVGKTGKISAHADKAVLEYIEREIRKVEK